MAQDRSSKAAIGKRLAQARKSAGYSTAKALSEVCGVPTSTIGGWESGRNDTSGSQLAIVLEALAADANWILHGSVGDQHWLVHTETTDVWEVCDDPEDDVWRITPWIPIDESVRRVPKKRLTQYVETLQKHRRVMLPDRCYTCLGPIAKR